MRLHVVSLPYRKQVRLMSQPNAIFIAATGQNVGKTTLCLGIIAALQKRFSSVGFIKPVGQRHVKVDGQTNVDKDAALFKNHFGLSANWTDMSPVILPSGFTKSYLDDEVSEATLLKNIRDSFHSISSKNAYTVVEGTGHVGVGSIVNLSNAKIAAELGVGMVIIVSAGLGSAYDELALNVALCQQYGVKIKGVILNRVMENKRGMIQTYFPKTLVKWGIPLIGCVPFSESLSSHTMQDFETLFDTTLLSGHTHHYRNFQHTRLVAGSLEAYEAEMLPNQLVITPASREDIIYRALEEHEKRLAQGEDFCGGMILTGRQNPSKEVLTQIERSDVPVLYAPLCSYDAMKMITSFTAKIRREDRSKIDKAIQLVEEYIDLDLLTA